MACGNPCVFRSVTGFSGLADPGFPPSPQETVVRASKPVGLWEQKVLSALGRSAVLMAAASALPWLGLECLKLHLGVDRGRNWRWNSHRVWVQVKLIWLLLRNFCKSLEVVIVRVIFLDNLWNPFIHIIPGLVITGHWGLVLLVPYLPQEDLERIYYLFPLNPWPYVYQFAKRTHIRLGTSWERVPS